MNCDREERDQSSHPVAEIRDVFGDSDEEDEAEYAVENDTKQDSAVSNKSSFAMLLNGTYDIKII